MLCSDGVSAGKIDDREVGALLGALPPLEAARILVDLANPRGGPDNTTVIVVRITHKALASLPENQTEPLPIGEDLGDKKAKNRSVVMLFWCGVVFFVVGLCMISATQLPWFISSISFVAAVMSSLSFGFIQKFDSGANQKELFASRRNAGQRPLYNFEVRSRLRSIRRFSPTSARGCAMQLLPENWSIDWSRFNSHAKAGVEAADKERLCHSAVREYSRALHAMMSELRHQRLKQKADDATIDL